MNFNFIDRIKKIMKQLQNARELRTQDRGDTLRKNMKKNFLKNEKGGNKSNHIASKKQSMSDSQGVSDFSGSAYNGPGNVDREKVNSNMSQRNF